MRERFTFPVATLDYWEPRPSFFPSFFTDIQETRPELNHFAVFSLGMKRPLEGTSSTIPLLGEEPVPFFDPSPFIS